MEYNFGGLWAEQFWGFYQFKSFCEYASDEQAQRNYYKQLKTIMVSDNGKSVECETPQLLIDECVRGNREALDMIKNHFIVFLFTRYETIIQETMKCLFRDKPERIIDFLEHYSSYKAELKFDYKEFIKSESKETYVEVLSERLSSAALSGPPSKSLKRLNKLLNFKKVNTEILDELMDRRNKIVHEGKIYPLSLDELEKYYEETDRLLHSLALALRAVDIPVVDPGALLKD